ncbi:hypothetical protein BC833DRAFT_619435 [Globomyces pollinis-pini]|nr:hypothetical protein BC833DRAFT_619435 [Globomyces pollinis-pini]
MNKITERESTLEQIDQLIFELAMLKELEQWGSKREMEMEKEIDDLIELKALILSVALFQKMYQRQPSPNHRSIPRRVKRTHEAPDEDAWIASCTVGPTALVCTLVYRFIRDNIKSLY